MGILGKGSNLQGNVKASEKSWGNGDYEMKQKPIFSSLFLRSNLGEANVKGNFPSLRMTLSVRQ